MPTEEPNRAVQTSSRRYRNADRSLMRRRFAVLTVSFALIGGLVATSPGALAGPSPQIVGIGPAHAGFYSSVTGAPRQPQPTTSRTWRNGRQATPTEGSPSLGTSTTSKSRIRTARFLGVLVGPVTPTTCWSRRGMPRRHRWSTSPSVIALSTSPPGTGHRDRRLGPEGQGLDRAHRWPAAHSVYRPAPGTERRLGSVRV